MTQTLLEAPPSRRQRMLAPALTIGTLSAATVALHLRDPHVSGSWGFCPSAAVGVWCPGCGGLRAVNDLTNLRLADAASSNLLLVVVLPFVVLALGVWTVRRWRGSTWPRRPRRVDVDAWGPPAVAFALLTGVFTILRNLDGLGIGAWLAPPG